MKKILLLIVAAFLIAEAYSQTPSFIQDSLDSYIRKGIKDWSIPGLSIVIVKDGKVVFMKGYGVRDLQSQKPVDENTLFMIASNTKLFTATSLALLETRGILSLNDKITKFFPDYKLYDPVTTQLASIRDFLTHRIGTKTFEGDFTFWNTSLTRSEIMHRMRLLKPYQIFRQNYGYCNSCFMTAGNVNDLSHWLFMQLDSGRYNGRQIIPWPAIQKTRDVNIILSSRKSFVYPMHFRGYGLGLNVADYNGKQIYWHTGGAGGMVSNVCFVPEEKLGIAILTNNDNQNFFELLRYQILDAYSGVPYTNRSLQQLNGFNNDMQQQLNEINNWKARVKGNKPELPVASYACVYTNELYGNIAISQIGNQLKINFTTKPDLSATLDYMDNGEWLMQYNNIEYGIFAIKFDIQNGKVKSVTTKQNPFVEFDPYTFVKK